MSEEQERKILQHLLDVSDTELALDELSPEMSLRDDLGFDSLVAVELVMELEEEFDVTLLNTEVQDLKTIGDVLKLVEAKQQGCSS